MRASTAGLVVATVRGQVLVHEIRFVDPSSEMTVRCHVRGGRGLRRVVGVDRSTAPEGYLTVDDDRVRGVGIIDESLQHICFRVVTRHGQDCEGCRTRAPPSRTSPRSKSPIRRRR